MIRSSDRSWNPTRLESTLSSIRKECHRKTVSICFALDICELGEASMAVEGYQCRGYDPMSFQNQIVQAQISVDPFWWCYHCFSSSWHSLSVWYSVLKLVPTLQRPSTSPLMLVRLSWSMRGLSSFDSEEFCPAVQRVPACCSYFHAWISYDQLIFGQSHSMCPHKRWELFGFDG